MRRERLKAWMKEFLEGHESRCADSAEDREALAEAFSLEIPGVLVEDDYSLHMDEMLGMHATYLEAQHQVASTKLKDDLRADGKQKVEHIVETTHIEELRERVADLRIAVEERASLRCPECGTAPPATRCKMDCSTRKFKGPLAS
jgi:hypothetical protein